MYYTQIAHPPAEKIGTSDPGKSGRALAWWSSRTEPHLYTDFGSSQKIPHSIHHHQGHDLSRPLPYSEMVRHVADVAQHQYMYLLLVMCVCIVQATKVVELQGSVLLIISKRKPIQHCICIFERSCWAHK